MHRPLLFWPGLLLLAALPAALAAQGRVIVVDSQNRPGTDFLDLPAAVAAANPGDKLRVRDGSYSGFSTWKPITILGAPGAQITTPGQLFRHAILIGSVPAGTRFVMEGIDIGPALGNGRNGIEIDDCDGRVHLENIDATLPTRFWAARAVTANRADLVSIANSRFRRANISLNESSLVMADTEVTGNEAFNGHGLIIGSPAIQGTNSEFVVSRCNLTGGDTINGFPPAPPQSAIIATNMTMTVLGDENTRIRAGGGGTQPVHAIRGTGTVTIHPDVSILGNGGAAPIVPTMTVHVRRIPSLSARGAPPGGTVRVDMFSRQGDSVALFAGLPGSRTSIPGLGDVWFDLSFVPILAASGVQGTSRHFGTSVSVPAQTTLLGVDFAWHGVSHNVVDGFRVSNVGLYVHD